jgi:hypothetical protein
MRERERHLGRVEARLAALEAAVLAPLQRVGDVSTLGVPFVNA